ncbi:hypothetical protein IHQ71_18645 [Rhizobium sp. TH2]|uniref:calcium-binding protein n=1 Tax=Rhizobium sp. TH2 TaxID=2775403 RepID=UPI0021573622|nr:hypothetical protein [Rhizobium sp. TH2]UVC07227.1 hypothetical protein IHQ71_18645 [Rhizobium sp. TH2]
MGTHTQNTDLATTWNINTSDEKWVLAEDAEINSGNNEAIFVDAAFTGNTIIVKGDITVSNPLKAIDILANDTTLKIAKGSVVDPGTSNVGLYSTGANFKFYNDGQIGGKLSGIYVEDGALVHNTGTIKGGDAVYSPGDSVTVLNYGRIQGQDSGVAVLATDALVVNADNSKISGGDFGIELTDDGNGTISNRGLIKGDTAISDMGGDVTVYNRGVIDGFVQLGAGQDTFDTRQGTLKGKVDGGSDADTYLISSAIIDITEQQDNGMDLVKSTVSYTLAENLENLRLLGKGDTNGSGNEGNNSITGNKGDNVLKGKDGDDYFAAGKGDDLMIGGANSDIFQFNAGNQHDTIKDFENGLDVIFSDFVTNETEFENLFDHHLKVQGDDLLIKFGDDTLLIKNMEKSDLTFDDFFTGI